MILCVGTCINSKRGSVILKEHQHLPLVCCLVVGLVHQIGATEITDMWHSNGTRQLRSTRTRTTAVQSSRASSCTTINRPDVSHIDKCIHTVHNLLCGSGRPGNSSLIRRQRMRLRRVINHCLCTTHSRSGPGTFNGNTRTNTGTNPPERRNWRGVPPSQHRRRVPALFLRIHPPNLPNRPKVIIFGAIRTNLVQRRVLISRQSSSPTTAFGIRGIFELSTCTRLSIQQSSTGREQISSRR